jgi:hypothetical protein
MLSDFPVEGSGREGPLWPSEKTILQNGTEAIPIHYIYKNKMSLSEPAEPVPGAVVGKALCVAPYHHAIDRK